MIIFVLIYLFGFGLFAPLMSRLDDDHGMTGAIAVLGTMFWPVAWVVVIGAMVGHKLWGDE